MVLIARRDDKSVARVRYERVREREVLCVWVYGWIEKFFGCNDETGVEKICGSVD